MTPGRFSVVRLLVSVLLSAFALALVRGEAGPQLAMAQ